MPNATPYRTLEIFSDLFRVLGFLTCLLAVLYGALVIIGGASTLPPEAGSVGAVVVLVLPAFGLFLLGMLLIAAAESIRLAVDCANHLRTIAANTAKVLLLGALALAAPGIAGAQCCGDCNGDRRVVVSELVAVVTSATDGCRAGRACCGDCDQSRDVSVSEVVTGVGHALGGCPGPATVTPKPSKTPTPTKTPTRRPTASACPYGFAQNVQQESCVFNGTYNVRDCDRATMRIAWASDGDLIVFVLLDTSPQAAFGAEVTDLDAARLITWSFDSFSTIHLVRGTATQSTDRRRLLIQPSSEAFSIDFCDFRFYAGDFTGQLQPPQRARVFSAKPDWDVLFRNLRAARGRS